MRKTPLKDDSSHCKTRRPQTGEKSPVATLQSPRYLGLQPNQSIPINITGLWILFYEPPPKPLFAEACGEAQSSSQRQVFKKAVWKRNQCLWSGAGSDHEKDFPGCPGWRTPGKGARCALPHSSYACVSCQEHGCLVVFSTIILPFIFWIIPKRCNWGISSTQGVSAVYIGLDLVLVCCSRQRGRTCEMQLVSAFFRSFSEVYSKKKIFVLGWFFCFFLNQVLGSSSQNIPRLVVWRGLWKWMEHWSQLVQSNLKLFEGLS